MSDIRDPRVFFAAERTLLAWSRTSITLMAFGFVIERFDLFLRVLSPKYSPALQRDLPFWIGLLFIALGTFTSATSVVQYRAFIRTLTSAELPEGYIRISGMITSLVVAVLGIALVFFLLVLQKG